MARALWKGRLTVGDLGCMVALQAAASTSDRVTLHTVNRKTGNRVSRRMVDVQTGREVPREDQIRGYELSPGEFLPIEPEEIAAVVPAGDKTLDVDCFVPCRDVDGAYFDRPYFVVPAGPADVEGFALIRDGMRARKVAALARAVLFRRLRTVLIRTHGSGLIGHTLSFDYEVRASDEIFSAIPKRRIEGEMLDLARHIIATKEGRFDPAAFDDRYDAALAALVKAKLAGKTPKRPRAPKLAAQGDLLAALRESVTKLKKAG